MYKVPEYVLLPNGVMAEVMPHSLIDELGALGKIDIMTNNYDYDGFVFSLYLSKATHNLYAQARFRLA